MSLQEDTLLRLIESIEHRGCVEQGPGAVPTFGINSEQLVSALKLKLAPKAIGPPSAEKTRPLKVTGLPEATKVESNAKTSPNKDKKPKPGALLKSTLTSAVKKSSEGSIVPLSLQEDTLLRLIESIEHRGCVEQGPGAVPTFGINSEQLVSALKLKLAPKAIGPPSAEKTRPLKVTGLPEATKVESNAKTSPNKDKKPKPGALLKSTLTSAVKKSSEGSIVPLSSHSPILLTVMFITSQDPVASSTVWAQLQFGNNHNRHKQDRI